MFEWIDHARTILNVVVVTMMISSCTPSSAAPPPAPRDAAQAKPLACYDNLCGDAFSGEQYCSCHGADQTSGSPSARCWSQHEDCEVDLACCKANAKSCMAQGTDKCSIVTHDERVKRDKKAKH